MPKNKEALIRYRVINRCFVERTYVTKKELKEACEKALNIYPIGERTIDADINAMRYDERLGYFAPIKIDRLNKTYFYDDPSYSIDNIPLNEEELNSIVFASRLLEQFKGIEILRTFSGSVQKLVDVINVYRQSDEEQQEFIEFEMIDESIGTQYINDLFEAIKNKKVLEIRYKSFTSNKEKKHQLHPYLLKEYRNRWYLIGYNDKYKEVRTYSLDRFISIKIDITVEYTGVEFDAKKYYENVIGVSVLNEEPAEIHISYSHFQAQYVITQPLHHSQELVEQTDHCVIFKYYLVPNFEFYAQILAWGDEVEVIKPNKVQKKIVELASGIISNYEYQNK
jgi:predicted DNA-binding transcriptional regulator YafY